MPNRRKDMSKKKGEGSPGSLSATLENELVHVLLPGWLSKCTLSNSLHAVETSCLGTYFLSNLPAL